MWSNNCLDLFRAASVSRSPFCWMVFMSVLVSIFRTLTFSWAWFSLVVIEFPVIDWTDNFNLCLCHCCLHIDAVTWSRLVGLSFRLVVSDVLFFICAALLVGLVDHRFRSCRGLSWVSKLLPWLVSLLFVDWIPTCCGLSSFLLATLVGLDSCLFCLTQQLGVLWNRSPVLAPLVFVDVHSWELDTHFRCRNVDHCRSRCYPLLQSKQSPILFVPGIVVAGLYCIKCIVQVRRCWAPFVGGSVECE